MARTSSRGGLDGRWTTYSSLPDGRIRITAEHGTGAGSFAMLMDHTLYGSTNNLNEAIWTVDLSGRTEATLSFLHADWLHEIHPFRGDFSDHFNADGVAISNDGVRWHPIWDPAGSQPLGSWASYAIDLAAEAALAGMTLGPDFRIKFQQYDNLTIEVDNRPDYSRDGRGYDEIMISVPPLLEGDWYRFTLGDGQSTTLALTAFSPGSIELGLYDHSQTLLASGSRANNLDRAIQNFVDATTDARPDTYYARVSGTDWDYSLVVTRNAAFDAEPNSSQENAQELSPAVAAMGYLQYPAPSPSNAAEGGGAAMADVKLPHTDEDGTGGAGSEFAAAEDGDYVPGRLIVRFVDAKTAAAGAELVEEKGAKVLREFSLIDSAVIELPDAGVDVLRAAARIRSGGRRRCARARRPRSRTTPATPWVLTALSSRLPTCRQRPRS